VPLICVAGAIYFKRSKFGVAIRAAAENGEAARLLGISVDKVSAFTWIVGSILAAIAGILVVDVRNSLDVATLSTGFLVRGLAAALLGGLTSLPGAIVGGVFVGVGESVLNLWLPEVGGAAETLLFAVIIVVLLFRPGGLFGQVEQSEDKVGFVPTLRELPEHLRNGLAARGLRWIGVGVLGVMILMSFVTTSKTNFILTEVVLFALVGVSLTVLMGYAGQISLGSLPVPAQSGSCRAPAASRSPCTAGSAQFR
jgi:ABC-type branched-subunit amino acid transport system permease subunit